jgi:catechol 2,3-dioxygenase-like lactoylglutathione lyase family enzyme
MDSTAYQLWLDRLLDRVTADPGIIGLVALGSTAATALAPDQWSDHDVWVVTIEGAAEPLRADPGWLPDAARIVGYFPETKHGRSVIYGDGHLVEIAIFDDGELELARANHYRVLYDAGGIAARLEAIALRTAAEHESGGGAEHFAGSFVTQMLIGLGRYGRGELLSANQLLRELAPTSLLRVVVEVMPTSDRAAFDNLDPRRRFELAYPEVAKRLDAALGSQLLDVAQTLLELATGLGVAFPADARPALGAVAVALERSRAGRPRTAQLDHVKLTIPQGTVDAVRRFYGEILGLDEVTEHTAAAGRGGCRFRGPTIEFDLSVEEPFRAGTSAHPAIRVDHLDELAERLIGFGYGVQWVEVRAGRRRFYTNDSVGNRLEFCAAD